MSESFGSCQACRMFLSLGDEWQAHHPPLASLTPRGDPTSQPRLNGLGDLPNPSWCQRKCPPPFLASSLRWNGHSVDIPELEMTMWRTSLHGSTHMAGSNDCADWLIGVVLGSLPCAIQPAPTLHQGSLNPLHTFGMRCCNPDWWSVGALLQRAQSGILKIQLRNVTSVTSRSTMDDGPG